MTSDAIAVTLVAGYLGSGKTTLINQLIRQDTPHRMAILVNDFGELAIDAALIEAEDENIISLSGGCVCCSYGNDLSSALLSLLDMPQRPDQIVVETSGVALPAAIAASISIMQGLYVNSTLVMLNVEHIRQQAEDRYVGDTITRQIDSADLLVLNKIDLVSERELNGVESWLQKTWPQQRRISARQSWLPASVVFDTAYETASINPHDPASVHSCHEPDTHAAAPHTSLFNSFQIDLPHPADSRQLLHVLTGNKAGLVRAKGFVLDLDGGIRLVQVVGRRGEISAAPSSAASKTGLGIVCIGLAGQDSEQYLREACQATR